MRQAVPVEPVGPSRVGGIVMVQTKVRPASKREGVAAPSLVSPPQSNSSIDPQVEERERCPNSVKVFGRCREHGNCRWYQKPCGTRDCGVCGPVTRSDIAARIAYGIHVLWPCALLVLTFADEYFEMPDSKSVAVRKLNGFKKWLRKRVPEMEFATTWELTKKGRLHINLIAGPWKNIPQEELQERWGNILWVSLVRSAKGVGKEAAKSYGVDSLAAYMMKLEQAVPQEWGRRVSFSKGWPKPEELVVTERVGEIVWGVANSLETANFERELAAGEWLELYPGEWVPSGTSKHCYCFDQVQVFDFYFARNTFAPC